MARYALYYAPMPDDPLGRFGQSWVGRDAWTGRALEQPVIAGIDLAAATAFPRRYGFHATMKAPFHLAPGVSEETLLAAAAGFATTTKAVAAPPLRPQALGDFLALTLSQPSTGVDDLAARCVREFDHLRAPITPQDRDRRLKSGLSARQLRHLDDWGYPYVFEDFTFHMTLTGPLPRADRDRLMPEIEDRARPVCRQPFPLDCLTVSREAEPQGPFRVIAAFRLAPGQPSSADGG